MPILRHCDGARLSVLRNKELSKKFLECSCNKFHLHYTNVRKNHIMGPKAYWHFVSKMKMFGLTLFSALICISFKVVCSENKLERCNQFFEENLSQLEQEDPKLIQGFSPLKEWSIQWQITFSDHMQLFIQLRINKHSNSLYEKSLRGKC